MTILTNGEAREQMTSEQIKADIGRTRSQMSDKIDTIQDRFNPDQLKQQAQETVRTAVNDGADALVSYLRENTPTISTSLLNTIRHNPIPAALIGIGAGWLLIESMSSSAQYPGNQPGGRAPNVQHRNMQNDSTGPQQGIVDKVRDSMSDAASTVRDKAEQVVDHVKDAVGQIADKASELTTEAKDKASQMTDQVLQQTQSFTGQSNTNQFNGQSYSPTSGQTYGQTYGQSQSTGQWVQNTVSENPLSASAVALVAGALLGLLLPATQREQEVIVPMKEQLYEQAQSAASNVMHNVQETIQELKPEVEKVANKVIDDITQIGRETLESAHDSAKQAMDHATNGAAHTPSVSIPNTTEGELITSYKIAELA